MNGDGQLVERTTVYCFSCRATHEAVIERCDDRIVGRVSCPSAQRSVELSSQADVFLDLRAKARRIGFPGKVFPWRPMMHLISITDQCNCRCPVCYAASEPRDAPRHVSVEEVARRALSAKRLGARWISLTGGEPTLHPELPRIVEAIAGMRLRPIIASNGLRLAEDPAYVRTLKESGLWKVNLQLDTFDPATHQAMRGNALVEAKVRAAASVVAAGLRLGTFTTVTSLNLGDVPKIVPFVLSLSQPITTIIFQPASTAGRFALPESTVVDRDRIIRTLLDSGEVGGATLDDVWPLPRFRPWGMRVHPDCGANLLLVIDRGRLRPLSRVIDIERLYARMGRNEMPPRWAARNLVPSGYLLASARPGERCSLLRCLWGLFSGSKQYGVVVLGIASVLTETFWNQQ
jgi:pyruvate-formate lyase-activating enzyme